MATFFLRLACILIPRRVIHALLDSLAPFLPLLFPKPARQIQFHQQTLDHPGPPAQVLAEFGKFICDSFLIEFSSAEQIQRWVRATKGWTHFERGLSRGKGLIVVGAHLGNWELAAVCYALKGFPSTVFPAPLADNKTLAWHAGIRQRFGIRTVHLGTWVHMASILRKGGILCFIVDRPMVGRIEQASFLGAPSPFSAAPAILSSMTGAPIVPSRMVLHRGRYDLINAEPLYPVGERKKDTLELTRKMAAILEQWVREDPQAWFAFEDTNPGLLPDPGKSDTLL